MKLCPYCGYSNYDHATQCRKCDGPFVRRPALPSFRNPIGLGLEKRGILGIRRSRLWSWVC